MSEEKTEVIRTEATVSVRPKAAVPSEADSERIARLTVRLGRTAATLREIAKQAIKARDNMANKPIGRPPSLDVLRAFEAVETIIRLASAALNAHDKETASEAQEKRD